ncbi:hypothetical protein KDH83_32340, partial [Achromobacter sp. Marseille-Q0513]|uniref:hypothetical protein n=1 Tax=Achromobacter sp. Marseille-Q0513 TaxID=2829161 RepID=UPI001B8F410A
MTIDGTVTAAEGGLRAVAGGDLALGAQGRAAAKGAVDLQAGRDLTASGALSSLNALTLQAARQATVGGKLYATGPLT